MTGVRGIPQNGDQGQHADVCVGKVGKDSAAARFASATPSKDFSIQESKPYAEVSVDGQNLVIQRLKKYSYGWALTQAILPKT